jgi:hypothetical protein
MGDQTKNTKMRDRRIQIIQEIQIWRQTKDIKRDKKIEEKKKRILQQIDLKNKNLHKKK